MSVFGSFKDYLFPDLACDKGFDGSSFRSDPSDIPRINLRIIESNSRSHGYLCWRIPLIITPNILDRSSLQYPCEVHCATALSPSPVRLKPPLLDLPVTNELAEER